MLPIKQWQTFFVEADPEGDDSRALVYRYVWRDDLSNTFDESVRV